MNQFGEDLLQFVYELQKAALCGDIFGRGEVAKNHAERKRIDY